METLLGWLGGLARLLALYSVFYLIGCLLLKLLTLGRYPDLQRLRQRRWRELPDFELVALFGFLCAIGLLFVIGTLAG